MNRTLPRDSAELDDLISTPDEATIESLRNREGDFAVLGAGGKMGFHCCLMLQKVLESLGRKSSVKAVSRFGSVRSRDEFEAIGCEVIAADLSDPEKLAGLPDVANVIFLAGIKFGTAHQPELLHQMNVEMPRLVAERFSASDIVALSTGCVYSYVSPESGGSTEESETDPPGAYAISCLGRERAFFDAGERFGTRSALIRLNYAIDLRYGVLIDLAQRVKRGEPIDLTTGYVNVIWQGDALRQTLRSFEYVAAPPFVLNVTGPEVIRIRDLAEAIASRFGVSVQFEGVEAETAWLNQSSKAQKLFGLPKVDLEQMIEWVAGWLETGGELLGKPTHFETRDGNY